MIIRQCKTNDINTGTSKCPLDFEKVIGAIVVAHGHSITGDLTNADSLKEACHAPVLGSRIFPIKPFVEFAMEGGDVNVSAVGYGGNKAVNRNAATYTFTMDNYYPELAKGLKDGKNGNLDVYFYDRDNNVYGMREEGGTDLMGIPLSCLYTNGTPFDTSSDNGAITISFAIKDIEDMIKHFDYDHIGYDVDDALVALTPIRFADFTKISGGVTFKLIEKTGGLDVTEVFATMADTNLDDCFKFTGANVSAASYSNGIITLTSSASSSAVSIADVYSLYSAGAYGFDGTNESHTIV